MEKLKIKRSDFKHEMNYNEWVEKFNFGGDYIQPTQYYQGNTGWGRQHDNTNVLDTLFSYFTKIKSFIFQF